MCAALCGGSRQSRKKSPAGQGSRYDGRCPIVLRILGDFLGPQASDPGLYGIGKDGYEALVDGRWVPIPGETILRTSNPTGRAVVCATVAPVLQHRAAITILCFVTPGEP